MNILKRLITVICLTAFLICLSGNIKAKADAIEASEVISNLVAGADMTSISYAYNNLSSQQKYIANYLMGAYNYAYLCARGFSFNIDQTETNMKAQLGAIGERIWQYMTTAYGWRSRFNEVFRQYASSIIVYSSKIDDSFNTWISDILSGTRKVYIEYSEEAFDAWTIFYNDPSGDGIAHFGEAVSDWISGNQYDFAFVGIPWYNATMQNNYNNFILNNSPVLYTNTYSTAGGYREQQLVFSFQNMPLVDTLFVLRANSYQSWRYGFSDFTFPASTQFTFSYVDLMNTIGSLEFGEIHNIAAYYRGSYSNSIPYSNLQALLNDAFNLTPIYVNASEIINGAKFYYPFIEHVYLVDDLNTLSNPEEVFNVDDFDIEAPQVDNFIITPNGKMLIPGYAPMTDPFADLWDVSVDIDNNQSTEDDYHNQIVNNTVINNYIVDDGDKINVPVEWFDNEYTDQLNYDAQPFFTFVRDCIRSLGDLQIYFYGAIVIGLGGGILKKFLL